MTLTNKSTCSNGSSLTKERFATENHLLCTVQLGNKNRNKCHKLVPNFEQVFRAILFYFSNCRFIGPRQVIAMNCLKSTINNNLKQNRQNSLQLKDQFCTFSNRSHQVRSICKNIPNFWHFLKKDFKMTVLFDKMQKSNFLIKAFHLPFENLKKLKFSNSSTLSQLTRGVSSQLPFSLFIPALLYHSIYLGL